MGHPNSVVLQLSNMGLQSVFKSFAESTWPPESRVKRLGTRHVAVANETGQLKQGVR